MRWLKGSNALLPRFPGVLWIVEPFNPVLEENDADLIPQPLFPFFAGDERHILLLPIACEIATAIGGFDILANECRARVGLQTHFFCSTSASEALPLLFTMVELLWGV